MRQGHRHIKLVAILSLLLGLLFTIACGAAAPDPAEPPAQDTAAPADPSNGVPTATPAPASDVTDAVPAAPTGTLNVGYRELGAFEGHPRLTGNPIISIASGAAITEALVMNDNTGAIVPMLAESWRVSDDFLTWTFNIREGVQLHKGYGEMTAEDVLWSIEELSQSERHPGSNVIRSIWQNPEGHAEIVDPYTIRVNTGAPVPDVFVFDRLLNPSPRSVWVASKQQSEELGAEVANRQTALTGSWGITEYRTGEFWRLQAVEDHWRKTPYFAEMVMWEIPEESSRMAGFQTGQLDTIDMNFDSIPLVESVLGSDLVRVPGAGVAGLNFYPGFYVGVGTPEQRPGYNSNLAWVSSNPDPASEEWERARLVRWALATAIDSEAIVETLLGGFGEAIGYSAEYAGHEEYLDSDMETWSFDPDRAVELLAQAGYPDGFSITLTTAIRAAPAEVEACEAVATMWGDIGIDVRFQRVPYSTLRPSLVARNNEGVTCHSNPFTISPLARASSLSTEGVFNHGAEHPFIEDIGPRMETELDPEVRRELERLFLRFLHDNALTRVGMYTFDNVWPVGPSIQSWEEHIKMGDTRVLNGMEYIRPR